MKRSFATLGARSLFGLAVLTAGVQSLSAAPRSAGSPWKVQTGPFVARTDLEVCVPTKKFQAFTADLSQLRAALAGAPLDVATAEARGTTVSGSPVLLSLPMPRDGKLGRFYVEEVSIMEPGLAAKYPQIKTYRGSGIDDPAAQLALDVTPSGFHAQILSPSGRVYISPYYFGGVDDVYASYYSTDADASAAPWACEYKGDYAGRFAGRAEPAPAMSAPITTADEARAVGISPVASRVAPQPQLAFGGTLRTYRLAVAANSYYAAANGGTTDSTLAAIVTVINRVSAIYEADCSLRLVLIAAETSIIYPNAASDPFVGNGTAVINTSTATISAAVGVGNYDMGHVFTTGSGGVSGLGVVCNNSSKGRSTTGLPTPYGDNFNVDYVVHEMGHSLGANHTFNGGITAAGSCSGTNRSAAHAYEPGSGTTIMAYAGICGVNNDLQPHSDSMFHSESLSEITTFITGTTGNSCPVNTTVPNGIPNVSAGTAYTIPISTPFTLTGTGSDPDGDVLTYSWEERDRGTVQSDGNAADNGTSPLFRTFAPVYSSSRTFPKMSDIVNNTTTIGERLPALARTLNMRLTVRDNRTGGGATNSSDVALTVSATAGPFLVTAPNTAVTVAAGSALPVTWNAANTTLPPVSVANVSIQLSTDGGYTYPYTLTASTPNSGTATVTLPAGVTSTGARVKVAAVGNVFFDISNTNFTIQ